MQLWKYIDGCYDLGYARTMKMLRGVGNTTNTNNAITTATKDLNNPNNKILTMQKMN